MRKWSFALIAVVFATQWASADLLTDHFGVTLTVQQDDLDPLLWTFSNDWTPVGSPTASWSVHDYKSDWSANDLNAGDNTQITGGEPYDVEAAYLDDDLENLYVAIVTSFPSPDPNGGYWDDRFTGGDDEILVHAGDLALDFGINGSMSVDDLFNYDWGVNLNNEVRLGPGSAEANTTPALGGSVYSTENSDWYTANAEHAADSQRDEMTNFDPNYTGKQRCPAWRCQRLLLCGQFRIGHP